ncbi:MAG: branched-chain amino acid ABC transporter permease [Sulfolobales archaeon]
MIFVIFTALLTVLPYLLPDYYIIVLSYALSFAIASLGFNLLLGYTGLLSFGHASFFAIGAYTVALIARYMPRIYSLEIVIPIALGVSALSAALIGAICIRHTEAHFSILMLAISMIIYSLIFKFYNITRGSDGLPVPIPKMLGLSLSEMPRSEYITSIFYYILISIFIASTFIMYLIVSSPFGKALQAIRDNPGRAYLIGINVKLYRYYSFILSGIYTGLAGALWSIVNGYTSPEIAHWTFSGEIAFMTLLGGYTLFIGPILGAIIYTFLKLYAVIYTPYWLFTTGVAITAFSLLLPRGIGGGIMDIYKIMIYNKEEKRKVVEKYVRK